MRPKFSAILFDGDGVAFDSEELSFLALQRALAEVGCILHRGEAERFTGMGSAYIASTLSQERGLTINPKEFGIRRDAHYRDLAEEQGGPEAMPGFRELLLALDEQIISYAIASSATRRKLDFNIERTGLSDLISISVSVSDVPRGKPSPDLFLEAARRLHATPLHCLVVEDSINGLQAGIAAGCHVAALEGSHPRSELHRFAPETTFANHAELSRYLFGN